MREVYRIDEQGFITDPVLVQDGEEVEEGLVDVRVPDGFYKPRFNGSQWEEGLTPEEIENLTNVYTPLTEVERLTEAETMINILLMGGL